MEIWIVRNLQWDPLPETHLFVRKKISFMCRICGRRRRRTF